MAGCGGAAFDGIGQFLDFSSCIDWRVSQDRKNKHAFTVTIASNNKGIGATTAAACEVTVPAVRAIAEIVGAAVLAGKEGPRAKTQSRYQGRDQADLHFWTIRYHGQINPLLRKQELQPLTSTIGNSREETRRTRHYLDRSTVSAGEAGMTGMCQTRHKPVTPVTCDATSNLVTRICGRSGRHCCRKHRLSLCRLRIDTGHRHFPF